MDEESASQGPEKPLLRVVRGAPDDVELAAVTAVVAGLASRGGERPEQRDQRRRRSRWSDPAARMRRPLRPSPGAWRASALPG